MTIGRTDVILSIDRDQMVPLAVAAGLLLRAWPDAVITDGDDTPIPNPAANSTDPAGGDIMVFQTGSAPDAIRRRGITADTTNKMVEVIHDGDELTVVVDDPSDATMARLIGDLRAQLCTAYPV